MQTVATRSDHRATDILTDQRSGLVTFISLPSSLHSLRPKASGSERMVSDETNVERRGVNQTDEPGNHTSKHSIFWSIIFYLVWFRLRLTSLTVYRVTKGTPRYAPQSCGSGRYTPFLTTYPAERAEPAGRGRSRSGVTSVAR